MLKIIFFLNKKNIVLIYFQTKNILKNNHYYIFKHPLISLRLSLTQAAH